MPQRKKQMAEDLGKFEQYFAQFDNSFVDRSEVLDLMKYALLSRQHLIVFGEPGTAKTQVANTVFGNIQGANVFEIELTKFMSEDGIFGPYNVKRMREDGVLEHSTDGMLPEADFARLGEFLDANEATLRSLLSALNERKLTRGRQNIQMPLMTAYADTNADPGVFLQSSPNAWAVLDRILFMKKIEYVTDHKDLSEIVMRYQTGQVTQIPIVLDMGVIKRLADITRGTPTLFTDTLVAELFGKAVGMYRAKRAEQIDRSLVVLPKISDRRAAWASNVAEVTAMMDGRLEVQIDDLHSCYRGLGSTENEKKLWEEICSGIVEEYHDTKNSDLAVAQGHALRVMERELGNIDINSGDIQQLVTDLGTLAQQIEDVRPENKEVGDFKEKLTEELEARKQQLKDRALTEVGL